ncbi:MAG: hypothetical protein RLZZ175_819 [Bacteroidota bacterium]|jgi:predicted HTH transcriptional regulator
MIKSLFNKNEYSEEDLNDLILTGIEESLNLDYKSARALDKSDHKKIELAKDISAFANSNGGIIIYGIEEQEHKPVEFSFVDGTFLTKEWLENVIDSNIYPRIQNVQIFPIRIDNQLSKTIYLLKIQESIHAPHMSADKKYYRRYNFKSVPMEEYEVRNLYNRYSHAEMNFYSIWTKKIDPVEGEDSLNTKIKVFIHIKNISQTLEKHCKLEASFSGIENLGVVITYQDPNINQRLSSEKKVVITSYNVSPIFPDEEISILRFELEIENLYVQKFIQNAVLELKLFDSSTTKTTEHIFSELMK